MKKTIEYLTIISVIAIMMILTISVALIPLMATEIFNLQDWDVMARIMGCIIALPMIRLTLKSIDWVMDLKYWS